MKPKSPRPFYAKLTRGGYTLYCHRCGTYEDLHRDAWVHDVALVHAQWFHYRTVRIPPMGMIV